MVFRVMNQLIKCIHDGSQDRIVDIKGYQIQVFYG